MSNRTNAKADETMSARPSVQATDAMSAKPDTAKADERTDAAQSSERADGLTNGAGECADTAQSSVGTGGEPCANSPQSSVALIVVDMQNDFVRPAGSLCVAGAEATISAVRCLIALAREKGWKVVYAVREHLASGEDAEAWRAPLFRNGKGVCVQGTWGAKIVDELAPVAGDEVVVKKRASAFFGTHLDSLLRGAGVRAVVVAGTQYPVCVRATAVDAMSLDYRTVLCTDACSAQTEEVAASNIRDLRGMGIRCAALKEIAAGV